MLGPAANVDQQAVKGGGGRSLAKAKSFGGAQHGALGRVRRFGGMTAEAVKPGDFRREVMHRPGPPRGKGAAPGCRRPQRLSAVEVA